MRRTRIRLFFNELGRIAPVQAQGAGGADYSAETAAECVTAIARFDLSARPVSDRTQQSEFGYERSS